MTGDWAAAYSAALAPHIAIAAYGWPDEDERVFLARHRERCLLHRFHALPDGVVYLVEADLSGMGRGVIELVRVPVSDQEGDLPMRILPDERRAELAELVAAARADLPVIPDTVDGLLREP